MALVAVKNPDDALDIVQDVMMTLARRYADKPQNEWPPLFYRILRNRITDFHRAASLRNRWFAWVPGRRTEEGDARLEDPIEQAPGAEQDTPEHGHRTARNRDAMLQAIAALPQRQQQAFMLRAWEGMDVKHTAAAMRCSEGSVKTHYSRAVHTLREQLGELIA